MKKNPPKTAAQKEKLTTPKTDGKKVSKATLKAEQKAFVKAWAKRQKSSLAFAAAAGIDQTVENLSKIDHIVVLMLENRSFDHMLGYLSLEGIRTDIDGLQNTMSNKDSNNNAIPVFHLKQTAFTGGEDPCHEFDCVDEQLTGPNAGFVKNFEKHHPSNKGLVMGYYNATEVPVFDHLAKHFVTFNRWFSSVPAATWPNRLYSITGRASEKKSKKVPIYNIPSFVRHLDANDVSWGWFNHKGVGTLRLVDGHYRIGHFDKFAYFDKRKSFTSGLFGDLSFIERAQQGSLPSVSWIDPNFINAPGGNVSTSNDDHPPSDILNGQSLVLQLYRAITTGPKWDKTLLIVAYDEHGGLFDHVEPTAAEDDNPNFMKYGVRVPAFIVSPYVEAGVVSDFVFDHTSIIKTILLRFCLDGVMYPNMGKRVSAANHLGSFLTSDTPRQPPSSSGVINAVASWKKEIFKDSLSLGASSFSPPPEPNDLHKGILAASKKIKAQGFPEDQP